MSTSVDALVHRIAAIEEPLTIRVATTSLHNAATQATAELLDALLAESRAVSVQWQQDAAVDGVIITIEKDCALGPVSFWGSPTGFELEGLVYALECAHRSPPTRGVSPPIRQLIGEIHTRIACDLYVAPT